MKKLRAVFVLSTALAVLAGLAFVNNLVAILRWWHAFLEAGGDTAGVPAHAAGCIGWLDWTAVDYSAVTTFIPLLGFICLARASRRLLRRREVTRPDDFPFFRGSDQLNVALGLFGTLWGIIVIGYFQLDTVTMADLMQCLHTALFSTLMAVVWVFLFDRPLVRPFFRRLLAESGLARVEEGDLAGAVDRLVERLSAASEAFDARQKQFEEAFARRQAECETNFTKRLNECEAAFGKRQTDAEAAFAKRLAESDEALAQRQAKSDESCAKRQADAEAAFARRQQDVNAVCADQMAKLSGDIAKALAELDRVRTETAAEAARELADYERAFNERQKEYVEFFKREISELERRAATSEEKLKAVAAALHA